MRYLEQLNADDGKHELQEEGNEHDVTDSFDGHDHALNDALQSKLGALMNIHRSKWVPGANLEAFCTVNGSQRSQHTADSKDFDDGNGTRAEDNDIIIPRF